MNEDDFERMDTNLKTVLRAIAYAKDKNKIELLEKIDTPLAKIEPHTARNCMRNSESNKNSG